MLNPSHCDESPLETTSEVNLGKHTKKLHETNFQCDFCDFHARNLCGLKPHIRTMHSLPQNMHECKHCTFTSKNESELKKHKKTFNITHSNLDYNEHLEEVNYEIFVLQEIGFMLLGMQHYTSDQWTRWMDMNFVTLGKNPQ